MSKAAIGEDMAADVVLGQVVPGERSRGLDPAGAEGLPVAQFDRLAVAKPDPGRQRQVAVIAQHDEIGHADLRAGGVGGADRRREEAGGAFQRRVGQAHLRQPDHRHAHHAELGAFEIELLFLTSSWMMRRARISHSGVGLSKHTSQDEATAW
jgi:hypothetical protein